MNAKILCAVVASVGAVSAPAHAESFEFSSNPAPGAASTFLNTIGLSGTVDSTALTSGPWDVSVVSVPASIENLGNASLILNRIDDPDGTSNVNSSHFAFFTVSQDVVTFASWDFTQITNGSFFVAEANGASLLDVDVSSGAGSASLSFTAGTTYLVNSSLSDSVLQGPSSEDNVIPVSGFTSIEIPAPGAAGLLAVGAGLSSIRRRRS